MGFSRGTWVFGLVVVLGFVVCQGVGGKRVKGGGGKSVKGGGGSKSCGFQAIYNFGDANSDTGGRSATIGENTSPYGETFFGKPSGRASDGRLIIDFVAEKLGLPYLSPYLDSVGANFSHGANFAVSGSSINPGGNSPFNLDLQISQFIHFKSRVAALYKQLSKKGKDSRLWKSTLPRLEDFSKALFTIDIGQNDIALVVQETNTTDKKLQASIPNVLEKFSQAIQRLYKAGARIFWVHNTGPAGCLPFTIFYDDSKPRKLDKYGCIKGENEVAKEFNKQLKAMVSKLRKKLVQSAFTYVDVYSAKYSLISNAKKSGFGDPIKFCCGSYGKYQVDCGKTKTVKGKVYGKVCANPSKYIYWDGVHYSEAANKLVANLIVNGSLSDPRVSVVDACHSP